MGIYEETFTFENLLKAERKAAKGKRHKKDIIEFESDLPSNIYALHKALIDRTYEISGYHEFEIYEPKKRTIQSLHYHDRIVQHCFVDEYLGPLLEKHLIYDNAACRKNKGTDFARNRLKKMLNEANRVGKVYVLQMDIHHYFQSIDHAVLKRKLTKLIKDEEMLRFAFLIIDSFHGNIGKGLPMGNQTSQCFALYYLDGLDRIIKERYQIKGYVRYMDDMVMLSNDKGKLKRIRGELTMFLEKEKLFVNVAKTHVYPYGQGITFLGFRFCPNKSGDAFLRLAKRKKCRVKRFLNRRVREGGASISALSYASYLSRAKEYRFLGFVLSFQTRAEPSIASNGE